jgi:hypothetical protein
MKQEDKMQNCFLRNNIRKSDMLDLANKQGNDKRAVEASTPTSDSRLYPSSVRDTGTYPTPGLDAGAGTSALVTGPKT